MPPDYSTSLLRTFRCSERRGSSNRIEINLLNPGLPLQIVNRFELGKPIEGISGSYDFIAPVALKSGSTIIYGDSKTDGTMKISTK